MYKKILIFILTIIFIQQTSAYDIDSFLYWSALVDASWDMTIEWWIKALVLRWIYNLWGFLGLAAVFGIVYGSLMMVIAAWEEEKVKKAKTIVIWSALWFLWVVFAASIIKILIEFMYSF